MEEKSEILPIVNIYGDIIGRAPRNICHNGSMTLHPVVHLHLINNGLVLLQKRAENKVIQPGKWDTAVGGHVSIGETVEMALMREAYEEIGLLEHNIVKIKPFEPYLMKSAIEQELVYSHIATVNQEFVPRLEEGEADMLKFWSRQEIEGNLGLGVFTPNFEDEYERFLRYL